MMSDIVGIMVDGDLLGTFVNAFSVIIALDLVSMFAFLISNVGKGSVE